MTDIKHMTQVGTAQQIACCGMKKKRPAGRIAIMP
jgi:hypothetical protein